MDSPVAIARSLASARLEMASRVNEVGHLRSELVTVKAQLADATAQVCARAGTPREWDAG